MTEYEKRVQEIADEETDTIPVKVMAYRVPICGDIYLAQDMTLKRCRAKNYSRRAHPRVIVYADRRRK